MPLKYDRQLIISTGASRTATQWLASTVYWSELVNKLATPARGQERLDVYLSWKKPDQDAAKDVGGFVGGSLNGQRRKAAAVRTREIVTLDLDNIPAGGTDDVLRRLSALGCAYCVYSTRKHHPGEPRLRVLIPLGRPVSADEYEPIARQLAAIIGIDLCDPTTFEASRLMYWPSASADSQYVYLYEDKPFTDPDGVLAMYKDWRNISEWPEVPGVTPVQRLAAKQGDPLEKQGIVGAFCRVYDIHAAIEELLPGVYEPCDTGGFGQDGHPLRYTYTGGSTTGGAVIYDDGRYLYSHHATDPCSGKLVNAFDLVRLNLYGDQDDEAQPNTPTNRLPSYTAMRAFASNDPQVRSLMDEERYQEAVGEFTVIDGPVSAAEVDISWMKLLKGVPGDYDKTITNVRVMLEHDPRLKGRLVKDLFADRIQGIAPLPWGAREAQEGVFDWTDADDSGLRECVERLLGFRTETVILDALRNHTEMHGYNPVAQALQSVQWDGTPRLDTLYIDYFGAEDCAYTRAVARKGFAGAVARAMTPGVKFDTMTVVHGRQGTGKSTFFNTLGKTWYTDSVRTFAGKDAEELLQGMWIIEIGELEALDRTDIKAVKAFLSKTMDYYRAAYGRVAEKHQRRCVFFGTTNDREYLRDPTGNRRFWPIDAGAQAPTKDVFRDLPAEVPQIWAEAYHYWQAGETIYLDREMEAEADKRRELHMERDLLQGQIEEFLERPVPTDWQRWTLERRRMYWSGGVTSDVTLTPRDRVCAIEVIRECLMDTRPVISQMDARRVNGVLERLPGWERVSTARFGPGYGRQRGFLRTGINAESEEKVSTSSGKSALTLLTKLEETNNYLSAVSTDKSDLVDKSVDAQR